MATLIHNGVQYPLANELLLVNCEGTDGSTRVLDRRGNHTLTAFNGAALTTADKAIGTSSLLLPTNGTAYVQTQRSANLLFGSSNFTLEFWMKWSGTHGPGNITRILNNAGPLPVGTAWSVGFEQDHGALRLRTPAKTYTSTIVPTANTWIHVAIVRNGGNILFFRDGVAAGTAAITDPVDTVPTDGGNPAINIGGVPGSNMYYYGLLDQVRVIKGSALYTAAFTLQSQIEGQDWAYIYSNTIEYSKGDIVLGSNNTYYRAMSDYLVGVNTAVVNRTQTPNISTLISEASVVWSNAEGTTLGTHIFSCICNNIENTFVPVTLNFSVDDGIRDIWLNNRNIFSGTGGWQQSNWSTITTFKFTLVPGENVIRITVPNVSGGGGLIFTIRRDRDNALLFASNASNIMQTSWMPIYDPTQTYTQNQLTFYNGAIYTASAATIAANTIPSEATSSSWTLTRRVVTPPKVGTINFYNEPEYIRVENTQQNTNVYFRKQNMTVQADTSGAFFIKNEQKIGYYNFADVVQPLCVNINDLVTKLMRWANDLETRNAWDLKNTKVLFELQSYINKNPIEMEDSIMGSATSVHDPITQTVTMSVTGGSQAVRRSSKQSIPYRLGHDYLALISGTLTNSDSRNTYHRIGLFSSTFSVMFRYANLVALNTKPSMTIQLINAPSGSAINSQMLYHVPQSEWNIDPLDGTGPSKLRVDWTLPQVFAFEVKCRAGMSFKLGVMNDSELVFCHEFSNIELPLQRTLPIRWVLDTYGASNISGTMRQGHAIVYTRNAEPYTDAKVFSITTAERFITTASIQRNLLTTQLQSTWNLMRIQYKKLQIINTQTGYARWELVLNPTTAPSTYTIYTAGSGSNMSETDVQINGGNVIASGAIGANATETIEFDDNFLNILGRHVADSSDRLALRVTGVYGVCSLSAAVTWVEYI